MELNLQSNIDSQRIQQYIDEYVAYLSKRTGAKKFTPDLIFPNVAGVYSIFDNNKLIYIGESGNLKKRLKDLRRTKNHSFRRKLGELLFSHLKTYKPATTVDNFPSNIETKLNLYVEQNLYIKPAPINLGRTEVEEQAIEKNKNKLLNTRGKRK